MNRREALKAVGGVIVSGKATALGYELPPSRLVVFFDKNMCKAEFRGFPPGTTFYPVEVEKGKSLDDAVRIFAE